MKIIFNGDDYGYSRGVNLAMIDCYQKGVMKSCSMMVNMPGAQEAADLMKENQGLSVGIHLTLTVGKPLTDGLKTLIKEDGTFNKGMLYEKFKQMLSSEELRNKLSMNARKTVEKEFNINDNIEKIKEIYNE